MLELSAETLEAVRREMEAMEAAMAGERSALDSLAAMLGVRGDPALQAAVLEQAAQVREVATEIQRRFGTPREGSLMFAGFCQGIAFATALERVRMRPQ